MTTHTLPSNIVTPPTDIRTSTSLQDSNYSLTRDPAFDNSEPTSSEALAVLASTRPAAELPAPRILIAAAAAAHPDRPPLVAPQLNLTGGGCKTKGSAQLNQVHAAGSKPVVKSKPQSYNSTRPKSTKPTVLKLVPKYQHSLNTNISKARLDIQNKFLLHSVKGIKDLCKLNNFTLSAQSTKSLDDCKGLYVSFISPTVISTASTNFLKSGLVNEDEFNNTTVGANAVKISMSGSKRFRAYVGTSTANHCEVYMRQLYTFFAIIGDYMSMLILLEYPPAHPPPMNPHSLLMFVYHRMESPGTPLCTDHHKSKTIPLNDVFGKQVLSEGSCRSKGGLLHVFQPINVLHQEHQFKGNYLGPCSECLANYQSSIKDGKLAWDFEKCGYHKIHTPPLGLLHGYGNPVLSQLVIVAKLAMDKLEVASGHEHKTRDSLMPCEIKELWDVLKANGFQGDDFMRFTMLLQAITLGNRTCGVLGTTMASFNEELKYGINSVEFGIQSIGVSVKEKGEKDKTVYSIKFKDDHPWCCFLRHLLIYVFCNRSVAGQHPDVVSDGFFTDKEGVMIVPPADLATELLYPLPISPHLHKEIKELPVVFVHGEPDEHRAVKNVILEKRQVRDYKCKSTGFTNWLYNKFFSAAIITVLDGVNLGMHSCRKSTYLWAILGGGEHSLVKEHVRHRTEKCEKLYRADSCTMKRLIEEDPELSRKMDVFPFEPSVINHKQANFVRLDKWRSHERLPNISTIQCLARYFVTEMLLVSPDHKQAKDHKYLLNIAYNTKFGDTNLTDMEQLIKTTPMSYERRMQFFRANRVLEDRAETTHSGGATPPSPPPSYVSNQSQVSSQNHSSPPGSLGVFGPSYEISLACKNDRPVDVFKLLVWDQVEATEQTVRFMVDDMKNFKKLVGRPSVFACHRLIHEVASTTAYKYNSSTAVHSLIDIPCNAVGSFSVLPNFSFGIIRRYRVHKQALEYFAHCLFTCHAGSPHCFVASHPNWAIVSGRTKQAALCLCTSEQCLLNRNLVRLGPPKVPKTPKTRQKKKRKVDA